MTVGNDCGIEPLFQSLLLADHVYIDRSGKYIVCGIFTNIAIAAPIGESSIAASGEEQTTFAIGAPVPYQKMGTPFAYVRVTGVRGHVKLELRYVRMEDHTVCWRVGVNLQQKEADPLQTVEVSVPLPRLPIEIGHYALELLHDNTLLGSSRVEVAERPSK